MRARVAPATVALAVMMAVAFAGGARPAAAAPGESEVTEARARYAKATRLFDLAEYDAALVEFKEAYRLVDDPAFLFNIAQCHRKLGHTKDELTFFRSYLRRAPHARNRPEVERRIWELERAGAASGAGVGAPLPAGTPPAATGTPAAASDAAPAAAPPLATLPGAAAAPAAPAPSLLAADPDAAARRDAGEGDAGAPFYRRAWFWVAVGAVAAGAVTAAVLTSGGSSTGGAFCPECVGRGKISP